MNRALKKSLMLAVGIVISLTMSATAFAEEHSGGHSSGGHGQSGRGHHGEDNEATSEHGNHRGGARAVEREILSRGRGGRPVWAQEGLPEVELGRLNAARAPDFVLDRALIKAHESLSSGDESDIHSPLQNLALYKEAVLSGNLTAAADYLGHASEKKQPITADTVAALNLILGVSVSNDTSMANQADQIRQTLAAEHDDSEHTDSHH